MQLRNISRTIEQAEAVLKKYSAITFQEDCICFPVPPRGLLCFNSGAHRDLALSIPCPRHGERISGPAGGFYQAEWLRESYWANQWAGLDPQMRKALQATFATRESYDLPSTADHLQDD